jgi:hypothetical protein
MKKVFFDTGPRALALDKNAADLFLPITAKTICLVCVVIRHAIRDYQSGTKVIHKFEANSMTTGKPVQSHSLHNLTHAIDTWERLRNTWNSYLPERDQKLRQLLLQQVNKMRNVTKQNMRPNQQALHDPWKDTTDDLEELDPDYDNGFTQLSHTVSVNTPPPSL